MALSFNKNDASKFTVDKRVSTGKHALMCAKAMRHEKEGSDNLTVFVAWRVLEDPEDPSSVTGPPISEWQTLPFDNPDVEEHEAPGVPAWSFVNFMHGFFPDEVPAYPRYSKEDRCTYYNGEVIEGREEEQRAKNEAFNAACEKMVEVWGDQGEGLTDLVYRSVYADVSYSKDGFCRISQKTPELPEDWELNTEIMEPAIDLGDVTEEKAEEKPKKKRGTRRRRK